MIWRSANAKILDATEYLDGKRSSEDTKGNVIDQNSKRLLSIKQKMECFDGWTASKNLPRNLMKVVMLRIVKVKNRLSITHALSAVQCLNTKVIWKGIWRAMRRMLWMIILFHLLLLRQQTKSCQIKSCWGIKLEWFKSQWGQCWKK